MHDRDILIISGDEVQKLLSGKERDLLEVICRAYVTHQDGNSTLPQSNFLRFPHSDCDRIIALPAFLGGDFAVAGLKWISSFPGNIIHGRDRASAVIILNSVITGKPEALLEGSHISSKRTAASAALAAQVLAGKDVSCAGLIGCGLINFEIARFLLAAFTHLDQFTIFDLDHARAVNFSERLQAIASEIQVTIQTNVDAVLASSALISIATTATRPHIEDLSMCMPGACILHVSLRDIAPGCILRAHNVVDDIDHVCRSETSVHLAEQASGSRRFIDATLANVILGVTDPARFANNITIFSPFGLGVLDLAVSHTVCELARVQGVGTLSKNFFSVPWRPQAVAPV